jgi:diaminopimelate epimerase
LSDKNPLTIETKAGILKLFYESGNEISVNMGTPDFTAAGVPMTNLVGANKNFEKQNVRFLFYFKIKAITLYPGGIRSHDP